MTARPGQANGPFSVGKRVYQVQTGFRYSESELNYNFEKTGREIFDKSTIFRIGIFEKTELRGGLTYNLSEKITQRRVTIQDLLFGLKGEPSNTINGVSGWSLGFRQNLIAQRNFIPAVGVQLTALFGGSNNYITNVIDYQLRILLQHKILKKVVLNTNFTSSIETENINYVFSLSYPLSSKFRIVTELFGTKYFEHPVFDYELTNNFDLGVGYLLSNNLQLDLFGGLGKNGSKLKSYFLSTGLSYRLNTRKE